MKPKPGLAGVASMGALFGCSSGEPSSVAMAATGEGGAQGGSAAMVPKYVFLFIGDGMSYPQIQATAYFNGAQQRGEESTIERVSFMDFPVIGSQYTYDSTSFCPDSVSTYAHSGLTVPVFALGAGAEVFDGFYDNTEIYAKLAALTGVA